MNDNFQDGTVCGCGGWDCYAVGAAPCPNPIQGAAHFDAEYANPVMITRGMASALLAVPGVDAAEDAVAMLRRFLASSMRALRIDHEAEARDLMREAPEDDDSGSRCECGATHQNAGATSCWNCDKPLSGELV